MIVGSQPTFDVDVSRYSLTARERSSWGGRGRGRPERPDTPLGLVKYSMFRAIHPRISCFERSHEVDGAIVDPENLDAEL